MNPPVPDDAFANVMTMVMYAFRAERKHITDRKRRERFRNAMEYSAIGMALVSIEGKWLGPKALQ